MEELRELRAEEETLRASGERLPRGRRLDPAVREERKAAKILKRYVKELVQEGRAKETLDKLLGDGGS